MFLLAYTGPLVITQSRPVGSVVQMFFTACLASVFWIGEPQRGLLSSHIVFGLRIVHIAAAFVEFLSGSKNLVFFCISL